MKNPTLHAHHLKVLEGKLTLQYHKKIKVENVAESAKIVTNVQFSRRRAFQF